MVTNEKLVGHIVFKTNAINLPPVTLPGLVPDDSTAYNATVARNSGPYVPGRYVVRVGEALAPPSDESLDASVSSSLTAQNGAWTNVTVTDIGTDPVTHDRLYQLDVVYALAGDVVNTPELADIVVRFSVKRVEPRRT